MRPARTITAEMENFRGVPIGGNPNMVMVKRDFVKPEPVGTIVLMAFRITGYDPDCDGSAMARLSQIDKDGRDSGWEPTNIGLYPCTDLVVSQEELKDLFEKGE